MFKVSIIALLSQDFCNLTILMETSFANFFYYPATYKNSFLDATESVLERLYSFCQLLIPACSWNNLLFNKISFLNWVYSTGLSGWRDQKDIGKLIRKSPVKFGVYLSHCDHWSKEQILQEENSRVYSCASKNTWLRHHCDIYPSITPFRRSWCHLLSGTKPYVCSVKACKVCFWLWIKCDSWCHVFMLLSSPDFSLINRVFPTGGNGGSPPNLEKLPPPIPPNFYSPTPPHHPSHLHPPSLHRKLFLALKKVRIIKITPPLVPFTR